MKINLHKIIMAVMVALTPGISLAQWGMVRFDEVNYFTKIETMTPDAALSFGVLQNANSFIMRTNDGGATWDSLDLNIAGNGYQIGCMNFLDVQNGFAGGLSNGTQALVKTNDNGTSWSDITPNSSTAYQMNGISFIDPQNGFAADEIKVYRTMNGGSSWVDFTPGLAIKDIGFASMDIGYACGKINPDAVVMKTINGGQTWTNVLTATLPVFTSNMQKIDVINQDVIFVSGQYSNILFKSLDGGVTWDTIHISQIFELVDFDFSSATYGQIVSGMGEIFSTNDGGFTWVLEYSVATGAYGPSVYLMSISFAGATGYVCGSNGLIKKYEASTGVNEITEESNLNIYPSPVSSNQLIHLGIVRGTCLVELFNSEGKLVKQERNTNQLQLNNISQGFYSVRITSDKLVQFGRFVVTE